MRNLSIIGLKLLGILGVYWAISEIAQFIVSILAFIFASGPRSPDVYVWVSLGAWLVCSLISMAFAVVLLWRTDWIVEALKFPQDPPSPGMDSAQILRIGFVLLGAYAVIEALPAIGSTIYSTAALHSTGMANTSSPDIARIVPPALKFIFGCILIGRSERFARSIFPASQSTA